MAVAQILTNSNLDGIYNASQYNDLLKNINQLGINSNYKNNIVNFINNSVIGNSLIEKDNKIYDSKIPYETSKKVRQLNEIESTINNFDFRFFKSLINSKIK